MTNDFESYSELRHIRSRLEGIEHTQEILVRAQRDTILREIDESFARDPVLEDIFVLVDGHRSQEEISRELKAQGTGAGSTATVTRRIRVLAEEMNLVELYEQNAKGKIYRKTAVDRILGLTRLIERRRNTRAKERNTKPSA